MAIIAFASGSIAVNGDPIIEYEQTHDPVVTQAQLPQDVNVYGNAFDDNFPGAVFTYQWNLVSQSDQNPAVTLTNAGLAQNVVVEGVNTWENIRLFLIATNIGTTETSETDPLKAPDSAFTTIRVRSLNASIQKMAAGERNWDDDAYEWADAIEALSAGGGGVHDHNIIDHLDVADATGADLEVLTSGGYANDPDANNLNPGGMLHKHLGSDVDVATVGVRGAVFLENAGNGAVVNVENMFYTAYIAGSHAARGFIPAIVSHDEVAGGDPDINSDTLCTFALMSDLSATIRQVTITMKDGGTSNPDNNVGYQFDLLVQDDANYVQAGIAGNLVGLNLAGAPAAEHAPMVLAIQPNVVLPKGDLLSLVCLKQPGKLDRDALGYGLTITIHLTRAAG